MVCAALSRQRHRPGHNFGPIPPQGTIAYRNEVARSMGAARAASFVRLFLVPGMHHCGGGTGPSDFGQSGVSSADRDPATNLAAALEAWVERGRAPNQVIAHQATGLSTAPRPGAVEGQHVRTGLICAYPRHASLIPGRDPAHAESYRCLGP